MVVNGSDRRRHIRVAPRPDKPIRVDINGENFIDIINAVDISEGGIGLTVPHQFKGCGINQSVSFIIDLPMEPKRQTVHIHGQILHIHGKRFGVSFKALTDIDRYKIKKYIASRIREDSMVDWLKYKVGLIH